MVILFERILRLSERYKGELECRKRRGREKNTPQRGGKLQCLSALTEKQQWQQAFNWFNSRGQIRMISIVQITTTFFKLAQLRMSVVFKITIIKEYSSGSRRGEMEAICKSQRKIKVSPLLFILIYSELV